MAAEPNNSQDNFPSPKGSNKLDQGVPRWSLYVIGLVVLAAMFAVTRIPETDATSLDFSEFLVEVQEGKIDTVLWDNTTSEITGEYKDSDETFETTGPPTIEDETLKLIGDQTQLSFETPTPSILGPILQILIPISLLVGIFVWMQRRAQGQMSGVMSIGRSKAKTYSTERPASTFADVAGYEGVKREVREVVDFLREPERFGEIGARIPKGVLLVGPPGTGKTLIARAVAGEAGVPFLSVSGSDFMEMFVGVGASRVRDLFESARKMGRAIIFIDEIDSIGRKRGAGMGGGHDEREQTLNQMLNEMDGFEATEGIVMIAATNRPDILDPALLRPGRFDRQVVVPLPELEDRRQILNVHIKHKRLAPDLDLETVARGTPGMSGAEIANLVNEAALHAVRQNRDAIGNDDFEYARDRVLMGQRRESMVLSDQEKELTAYHEAGHAICATVLPTADPLHKVTILPIGMALGVTQQLPSEDRHSYDQQYLEESIIVAMGGRIAEKLVFGVVSTGANNDLVVSTERARKMVREWGMSPRIGPMAWGGQGQVFLGESLMSQPEYSEETSRVVDEEVERILRECEQKCLETLTKHRNALDLVARGLLEYETISGAEVQRLVTMANEGEQPNGAAGAQTQAPAASTPDISVQPEAGVHPHQPVSTPPNATPSNATEQPQQNNEES